MPPFLAWGDFHARSRLARSTISEEKWGTTRSLAGYWRRSLFAFLLASTSCRSIMNLANIINGLPSRLVSDAYFQSRSTNEVYMYICARFVGTA